MWAQDFQRYQEGISSHGLTSNTHHTDERSGEDDGDGEDMINSSDGEELEWDPEMEERFQLLMNTPEGQLALKKEEKQIERVLKVVI